MMIVLFFNSFTILLLLLLLARLEANSRSLSTWVAVGDVQSSTSQLPSPQVFVFQPHQLTMIIFSTSTKCKKIVARHHRFIVDTIIIATNSTASTPTPFTHVTCQQLLHHSFITITTVKINTNMTSTTTTTNIDPQPPIPASNSINHRQ